MTPQDKPVNGIDGARGARWYLALGTNTAPANLRWPRGEKIAVQR
jgi:hypothetical protein